MGGNKMRVVMFDKNEIIEILEGEVCDFFRKDGSMRILVRERVALSLDVGRFVIITPTNDDSLPITFERR